MVRYKLLALQLMLILFIIVLTVPAWASSQKFVAVSGSDVTTVALDENGSVWLWGTISDQKGSAAYDQFAGYYYDNVGDTYFRIQATPVQLPLSDITAVSGSNLALKRDGTVWAWGSNVYGQLGDGTNISSSTPVKNKGLDHIIAISSNGLTCLALKSDGSVWAWGQNDCGQAGDGTLVNRFEPVQVKGISNVTAIYGGAFAVEDNGSVWTWGTTLLDVDESGKPIDYWARGLGKDNCKPTPFLIPGISNVKAIDVGLAQQVVLVENNGTVWSWGSNMNGSLGDGSFIDPCAISNIPYIVTPVQAEGLTDVKTVIAGAGWSMALKTDGTVWAWGFNDNGVFGNGKMNDVELVPVELPIKDVVAISGKMASVIFLKKDGSVWACGNNYRGSVGYGNTSYYSPDSLVLTPVKILGPENSSTNSTMGSGSIQNTVSASVMPPVTPQSSVGTPTPTAGASAVLASTDGFQTFLAIVSFIVACGLILSKGKIK